MTKMINGIHVSPVDNRWGHAIDWMDWDTKRVVGWLTPRPVVGDVFYSQMQSGDIAAFKFVDVEYQSDPYDMFFGTVEFVEYV